MPNVHVKFVSNGSEASATPSADQPAASATSTAFGIAISISISISISTVTTAFVATVDALATTDPAVCSLRVVIEHCELATRIHTHHMAACMHACLFVERLGPIQRI